MQYMSREMPKFGHVVVCPYMESNRQSGKGHYSDSLIWWGSIKHKIDKCKQCKSQTHDTKWRARSLTFQSEVIELNVTW